MDAEQSFRNMSLKATDVARVVVAVDFGTTFSGFAYAHRESPADVHKLYEWDGSLEANAVAYCKTQTSLYYAKLPNGGLQLKEWGWPAFVTFNDDCKKRAGASRRSASSGAADEGYFVTWFKLHLAGASSVSKSAGGQSAPNLPPGLTVETAITDYLNNLSTFAVQQLQNKYGPQLTAKEIQWCLTVPAIWDDIAKQKMKVYAEKAGMVQGRYTPKGVQASPHRLVICLEPEAASLYCLSLCEKIEVKEGDQYLIADIGGGTVDIVVHERTSSTSTLHGREVRVKEVVASYGGLCGGTYVDKNFQEFLNKTVGCFQEFTSSMSTMNLRLEVLRKWELGKRSYNGDLRSPFAFQFSGRLADAWEKWDQKAGLKPRDDYEELELTNEDMKHIFDPVVDDIIHLIRKGLTPKISTIMLVGGFSSSPYLKARITRAFSNQVHTIINPPEAGAAICHGAVLMGLAQEAAIVSRIARKTYGIRCSRDFEEGDPPQKKFVVDGVEKCSEVFEVYAKKGAVLLVNEAVCRNFWSLYSDSRKIAFPIYSSPVLENPGYVTDEGVVLEGTFEMDISDGLELGKQRSIEVTMLFGKSAIEVQGRRRNFGDTTLIENFFLSIDD